MSVPTFVGGTSDGNYNTPLSLSYVVVSTGNALILSIAYQRHIDNSVYPTVSDTQSNIWQPICMTPWANWQGGDGSGMYTLIALNCTAGAVTITVNGGGYNCAATLCEYANVAHANAIKYAPGSMNFASVVGASSVDSGSVTIDANQMLYSAAFSDSDAATLTPSVGFTARENFTAPARYTIQSWDYSPAAGSYNNVVTEDADNHTLQVCLIALSSAAETSGLLVQVGCGAASGITGPLSVDVPFPYDNAAGNLLIACGSIHERANFSVTDTQGNTWVTVYNGDGNPSGDGGFVLAYALSCAAGANIVTVHSDIGGDDILWEIIVAEYNAPGAAFNVSNFGYIAPTSSQDTGSISTGTNVPQLLISFATVDALESPPVAAPVPFATSPGTWRFQTSDGGFFTLGPKSTAIADQYVTTVGNYHDLFDVSPLTPGKFIAAILAFTLEIPAPVVTTRCADIQLTGVMFTDEITVDLDADWDDKSTFIITQDDPFPFTLRGLVWRESVNQD